MKKLTLLLLTFVVGICGVTALAENEAIEHPAQTVQTADNISEVGLLKTLGILDKETDDINSGMTREDFAVSVSRMLNIHTDESAVRYFSDVEQSGYAVSAINALVERKIISCSSDNRFRPMEYVTVQEAIKMLICALGYGE